MVFVHTRGDYECLPETVISLVGVAEPNYKSSAVCISSQQCTYNRVLKKSRYLATKFTTFGKCSPYSVLCHLYMMQIS